MTDLYPFAVDVLGKTENDFEFKVLIERAGEQPIVLISNERAAEFLFKNSGLQFCFDKKTKHFSSVFFHIESEMAKHGEVGKYNGSLPGNVKFRATQMEVEKTLGIKPGKSQIVPGINGADIWETYRINGLDALFIFNKSDSILGSVSLRIPGEL